MIEKSFNYLLFANQHSAGWHDTNALTGGHDPGLPLVLQRAVMIGWRMELVWMVHVLHLWWRIRLSIAGMLFDFAKAMTKMKCNWERRERSCLTCRSLILLLLGGWLVFV